MGVKINSKSKIWNGTEKLFSRGLIYLYAPSEIDVVSRLKK